MVDETSDVELRKATDDDSIVCIVISLEDRDRDEDGTEIARVSESSSEDKNALIKLEVGRLVTNIALSERVKVEELVKLCVCVRNIGVSSDGLDERLVEPKYIVSSSAAMLEVVSSIIFEVLSIDDDTKKEGADSSELVTWLVSISVDVLSALLEEKVSTISVDVDSTEVSEDTCTSNMDIKDLRYIALLAIEYTGNIIK